MLEPEGCSNFQLPFPLLYQGKAYRAKLIIDHFNSRIKIIELEGDKKEGTHDLELLAGKIKAGKIIVYAKKEDVGHYNKCGFAEEGKISGFFLGMAAHCLVAYPEPGRAVPQDRKGADRIVREIMQAAGKKNYDYSAFSIRQAAQEDCSDLAELYKTVFHGLYPTPISDPSYLRHSIREHNVFWLVFDKRKLCGAASLDVDLENLNAEVTDCAVLPEYRGKGLLAGLIEQVEATAKGLGLGCLYSLSRALFPGINAVLAASGYGYGGRLINNCRMYDSFEDMNIWVKNIT